MPNRLFWGQAPRAVVDTPLPNAQLTVYQNRTTTQIQVTDAEGNTLTQPLESAADGTFPAIYRASTNPVRVLIADEDGAPLPGYPQDDCLVFSTELSAASGIPFSPTDLVPEQNVQDAIELVAEAATNQSSLLARTLTFWTTGGSGNAYTITPDPAMTSYDDGQGYYVVPNRANTGAATLNVNGFGAREIRRFARSGDAEPIAAGDLQPGTPVLLIYNGFHFVMASEGPRSGSNANGTWIKLPGGLMICYSLAVTVAYASAAQLSASWIFPAEFASTPVSFAILPGTSVGTWTGLVPNQIGMPRYGSGATSTSVAYPLAAGAADFEAGDSITNVRFVAIGSWF